MIFIGILVGILILTFLIVAGSQTKILKVYNKYLKVRNSANLTGAEFASICIDKYNLDIDLALIDKKLGDAYSAKYKTLFISDEICDVPSLSSIAIVSHELGHALQHKENSKLFSFTNLINKLTRFTNKFILPLAILGIVLFIFNTSNTTLIYSVLGVCAGFFLLNLLSKFLLIPLERDASKRALNILENNNFVNKTELKRAKKLLNIAGQTYISSFFDDFLPFGKEVKSYINKN